MGMRRGLALLVMASLLAGMVLVTSVSAADNSSVIGMVDVEQILKDYDKKKESDVEVQDLVKSLQDKFDLRNQNKLLSDAEMDELEALHAKDKPTDKEKARVTELENLQKTRDDELKDLQAKKQPTEQEKARLNELMAQSKKSDDSLAKLAKDYSTQIENKRVELGNSITKEVLDAIKVVAQQKNIGTVVDKVAVLFGGVDITAPVLEQLNKKK